MKSNSIASLSTGRIRATQPVAAMRTAVDAPPPSGARIPGTRVRVDAQSAVTERAFRVDVKEEPASARLPTAGARGTVLEPGITSNTARAALAGERLSIEPILSSAARLLSDMPGAVSRNQFVSTIPIIDAVPTDTRQFATALHHAFAQGGLFYESHLAQWLVGQRTKDDLMHEPQATVGPLKESRADPSTVQHTGDAVPPTSATGPAPGMTREAAELVQQQLVVLDTGHAVWRGLVWADQTLEWEIDRDAQSRDEAQVIPWQTRLHLSLMRLGDIEASIAFASTGMRLHVSAAEARAAQMLSDDVPALSQALRSSGLNVSRIEVVHARA